MSGAKFIKLQCGDALDELLRRDHNAFALLTQIATRARYTHEPSLSGLGFGEALIGDHERVGMTRSQYRTAQRHLERWGLASFRGVRSAKRGERGTIARLLDSRVFSLTDERNPGFFDHQSDHHVDHQFSEGEAPDDSHRVDQHFEHGSTADRHGRTTKQKKQKDQTEQTEEAAPQVPAVLNTPAFQTAWASWLEYRKERRLPKLIPKSAAAQLSKLAGWGHDAAIESIRESIAQQWHGLFQPKTSTSNANHRTSNSRSFSQSGSYAGVTDKG